jgi:tetratricopeptide (TPR) repeat protein
VPWLATTAVALVLLPLGVLTSQRNADYSSAVRLWSTAVQAQPSSPRPRVAHGEALAAAGQLAEAEAQLRAAVDLDPSSPVALVRLGTVQAAQGRFDDAVRSLEGALALSPDDLDAHRSVGRAYAALRQDARAVPHLERTLAAQPDDPVLLVALATIFVASDDRSLRNPARAADLAERAVQLTGRRDPVALDILAGAQAQAGRIEDAVRNGSEALALLRAQGNAELAAQVEMRLQRYREYQQLLGR